MGRYLCAKCKHEYDIKEIRFTGSSKYECVYCLGIVQKDVEPKPVAKAPSAKEEMVNYVCSACGYAFKRKKSAEINKCPYCSKESLTIKKMGDAAKLIDESLDRKFEF